MSAPPIPTKKFRSVLTKEAIATVDRLTRQGLPAKNVAGGAGISYASFCKWIDEGMEENCPDPLKVELAVVVAAGRSQNGAEFVDMLKVHAMSDFRAAIEWAKAVDPETWNPAKQLKVDAKIEASSGPQDLSGLDLEDLQKLREINRKLAEAKAKQLK